VRTEMSKLLPGKKKGYDLVRAGTHRVRPLDMMSENMRLRLENVRLRHENEELRRALHLKACWLEPLPQDDD
jgi:hypothetical protein